jgi:hypothetical protein
VVNLTGMSGAVLLVEWGVVENDAMELEIESVNCGSWVVMAGRMEVPLHDVKTLVLWEFTKHRMEAPRVRTCSHRKWRSGR